MSSADAKTRAALVRLDPAPDPSERGAAPLTASQRRQADLTLDRILAAGLESPLTRPDRSARRSRGRSRGRVLAPLVALVCAVAVVVPIVTTAGDKAYASWSPLPVPLSAAESAAAAQACLGAIDRPPAAVPPLLAERRGAWTYVLVRPAKDVQASCIMPTDEIGGTPGADHRRWFSSVDEEVPGPVRDADEVRVDDAATATTAEGLFRYSDGAVGRDVVDLTFTTPRGVVVRASVANGRYAVWWPAGTKRLQSREISEAPKIDVALADGTTYRLPR